MQPPFTYITQLVHWRLLLFIIAFNLHSSDIKAQFGTSKLVYDFGGGELPNIIQVGDVDNDGDIDVILARDDSNDPIFWKANDGKGNFTGASIELPAVDGLYAMAELVSLQAADFDNDGDLDIIGAFRYTKKIHLWRNTGSGQFSSPFTLASDLPNMHSMLIYDMDKDGDQDIVVAQQYSGTCWLENNNLQDNWVKKNLTAGYNYYIDIDDVDGDDVLDVFSLYTDIYKNGKIISTKSMSHNSAGIKLVDVDSDGDLDVIAAPQSGDYGISWLENKKGKYIHHVVTGSTSSYLYYAFTIFDYDDDGDQDILAGCFFGCGTDLYENTGGGEFSKKSTIGAGGLLVQTLLSADIDGDGKKDIIRANAGTHTVNWQPNIAPQYNGIEASFKYEGKCVSDSVFFINKSRGKNITSFKWNFGDGAISTEHTPIHKYNAPGDYIVTLIVSNASGESHAYRTMISLLYEPKATDQNINFCDYKYTISLDPSYQYKWYTSLTNSSPFQTGTTLTNTLDYTYYVSRSGQSGCYSERTKIVAKRYYEPAIPKVKGSVSYGGSAELTLEASTEPGNNIYWTKSLDGDTFFAGNKITARIDTTTTYYVRAINAANCLSRSVPVMSSIYDQPIPVPGYQWAKTTSSNGSSFALDLIKDYDGNYVSAGTWYGGGKINAGDIELESSYLETMFLFYYDHAGNATKGLKVLGRSFVNHSFDYKKTIIDREGNVYIIFDLRNNDYFTLGDHSVSSDYSYSTCVGKLDKQGNYLWHKIINNGSNSLFDLLSDDNLVGMHWDNTTSSMKLTKYSSTNGDIIWENITWYISLNNIAIDKFDNIYVGGSKDNASRGVIYKFNSDGVFLWSKDIIDNWDETKTDSGWLKLSFDGEQNLVVTAYYFGVGAKTQILGVPLASGSNTVLAKLDAEGSTIWAKNINGLSTQHLLRTDAHNNIYIVGAPQIEQVNFDWTNLPYNYYIAKYNTAGILQWVKESPLPNYKIFNAIIPDDEGNVIVQGSYTNTLTLGEMTLTNTINNAVGGTFISKMGYTLKSDFKYDMPCANRSIQFRDWSTSKVEDPIAKWEWDFGDGKTSLDQNPQHVFSGGTYTVILKIICNSGDTAVKSSTLITQPANADFDVEIFSPSSSVCQQDSVVYTATFANAPESYSLQWYVDDVPQASATGMLEFKAIADKQKEIKVVVNSFNCSSKTVDADSIKITVNPVPDTPVIVASETELCSGEIAVLSAVGEGAIYNWSNSSSDSKIYVNETGTYYLKTGITSMCFSKASNEIKVNVYNKPEPPVIIISNTCTGFLANLSVSDDYLLHNWSTGATTNLIHVSVPGIFSVSVGESIKCMSEASTKEIIFYEKLPRPEIHASSEILCEGDEATLESVNAYSHYEWSNGIETQTIELTTPGSYYLKVGNTTSCLSNPSLPVSLIFKSNPQPLITVLGHDLIASSGVSYIWFKDNELTNYDTKTITPTESGTYTVEVLNDLGCSAVSSPVDMIITGVEGSELANTSVFPNPVTKALSIITNLEIQMLSINDALGCIVFQQNKYGNELNLESLSPGVYNLVITYINQQTSNHKIVKY